MMLTVQECDAMLTRHIAQHIGILFRCNAIYFLPALS